MSDSNGLVNIHCPLKDDWHRISGAMDRSEAARGTLQGVAEKVAHLDTLPVIAAEIKNSNKNNTMLLIFMAFVLIVNAGLAAANIYLRASALGVSTEMGNQR